MPALLVIEDDVGIARLLTRQLEKCGYLVHHVGSGEDALAFLQNNDVDAVVCDLGLPGISGVVVVEALRAQEKTRRLPIVVLSARVSVQDHTLSLEAGADAFFEKPIKLKALHEGLRMLLAGTV